MTVRQLIDNLKNFPPEYKVVDEEEEEAPKLEDWNPDNES